MRSKDTEFAAVKLPRCLVCGGVKVEWGRYQSRSSGVCCTRDTFDGGARHNTKQPRAHDLAWSSSTRRRAPASRAVLLIILSRRNGRGAGTSWDRSLKESHSTMAIFPCNCHHFSPFMSLCLQGTRRSFKNFTNNALLSYFRNMKSAMCWLMLSCSALVCTHDFKNFLSSIQVFYCKTFTMLWYDASYCCLCV